MIEHWWLTPETRGPLEARARLDVAAWMQAAEGGTPLSSDRQSVAALLRGDPPLLVKWRRPRTGKRWRTYRRMSRERKEARAYLRLAIRGIRSPLPWAVGERRHRGLLVGSVLVRRFSEKLDEARTLAAKDGELLVRLGAVLRGWHDKGFRHGDCYPKNVLVPADGTAPLPIGCPIAEFVKPGAQLDRRRKKDLAQWAAGVHEIDPSADPFGFLETYVEGGDMPVVAGLRDMLTPFYERIMSKKRARVAGQAERDARLPRRPDPLPDDGPPGPHIREHDLEALLRGG